MLPNFDSYTWDSPLFPKLCTELLRIERNSKEGSHNQLIDIVFSFPGLSLIKPLKKQKANAIRNAFHRRLLKMLKRTQNYLSEISFLDIITDEFEETLDDRDKIGMLLRRYKTAVRDYAPYLKPVSYRELVR
jgi:hypothetical protein